ncbi:MAG TPA: hypothetical protein VEA80_12615 [Vitreimonas sp.]|uniref:hypothetical protein n=1 Tax=Vitreimonas sp. TaxID=3069702 RepID=UPI002D744387|nr:hypothetical protein [Vitreimonas sp.]HYD88310.1 hypothetical protein [Vitreimonas sp.]
MKKTALLAAAAAMMMATPAAAQGYLGAEYGNTNIDFFGSDTDADKWQGEGAFGWNHGSWGGQIGGSVGNIDAGGGDVDFYDINGHLYWDGGAWKLGVMAAQTQVDDADAEDTTYGLEAMFDTSPNSNIFASYTMGESEFLTDWDVWNFDAGVNFYTSPNMRIGAFAGTGNVDGGGLDADSFSFGINGEFQPWSAPVSITLGWNSFEIEDIDLESNTFTVGARWNFGGGTLQDRNNATPFSTPTGLVSRTYGVW